MNFFLDVSDKLHEIFETYGQPINFKYFALSWIKTDNGSAM